MSVSGKLEQIFSLLKGGKATERKVRWALARMRQEGCAAWRMHAPSTCPVSFHPCAAAGCARPPRSFHGATPTSRHDASHCLPFICARGRCPQEGLKELLRVLDSDPYLRALDATTAAVAPGAQVPPASWPGLAHAMCKYVGSEVEAAKNKKRGPEAALSRGFRLMMTRAEEGERRSGHARLMVRRAGTIFRHVTEVLQVRPPASGCKQGGGGPGSGGWGPSRGSGRCMCCISPRVDRPAACLRQRRLGMPAGHAAGGRMPC